MHRQFQASENVKIALSPKL